MKLLVSCCYDVAMIEAREVLTISLLKPKESMIYSRDDKVS